MSAAQDIWEILAPSDGLVIVHQWSLFQTTDTGDSEEEILELETVRGLGSTSGSGGTVVTPHAIDNGDADCGCTVEGDNTTRMTGGTLEVLEKYGFNVRMPLEQVYAPEYRPIITPGDRWTLALNDAPNDSITVSSHITFEEIGG